ncbi:MAG: TIGR00266 family protein [Spirochaetaceae bacterium]|nr:TIGR00266 family protein [Spirochaetaceae bacterium]
MDYTIENRPVFTTLKVQLAAGETLKAEAGAMVSMSSTIELKSKTTGKGLGGMFKAAIGGEGLFSSEFTAVSPGEVVVAPPVPGDIIDLKISGQTIFCQGGAYLAGSTGLELSTQGSLKGLVSGEGLFLQKISGAGDVFLSCYGAVTLKELGAGETYIVDTGHMVAFEESVSYTIRKAAKGLMSTVLSGEGLTCEFSGPGKVWIQSRNIKGFASLIAKLIPNKS